MYAIKNIIEMFCKMHSRKWVLFFFSMFERLSHLLISTAAFTYENKNEWNMDSLVWMSASYNLIGKLNAKLEGLTVVFRKRYLIKANARFKANWYASLL